MALISFDDKAAANENSSVPAVNKGRAVDWNEVKNVVNGNYNEYLNDSVVEYQSGTTGHIKYNNGFQIAWVVLTNQTCGGNAWQGLYYSDHSMGNWSSSFTVIYNTTPNVDSLQFWCSCGNISLTSAGTVRALRPNNTTATASVSIIGFGKWK